MKTDNNYVRSGRERIKDDNYQTVDPRCLEALLGVVPAISKTHTIVDPCSNQGSEIINWFIGNGFKAVECSDAFSKDYYCDWDITNPPYTRGLVDGIIQAQLDNLLSGRTRLGVAILVRTAFDHAKTRTKFFRDNTMYCGQIKMMFRPKWFLDTDVTPIHNYVWHIWDRNWTLPHNVWYW